MSERGESRSERTFQFTTIDVPNAASTAAWGINARGDIVGAYVDGNGRSHGYLLRDGEFVTIDFPGSAFTEAHGIGTKGEIVGAYRNLGEPPLNLHGFMWKKGAFVQVNDPPHINTVAQRILPDGTILGCRHGVDQMATMRGIIIGREGSIAELDVFGSMENGGTPDHRRVVGLYFNMAAANRNEGFLIDDDEFTPLLVPGSTLTQAWDINPAGQIIGFYRTAGVFHGFVLSDDQYTTVDVPGATATRIRGINSRGDIVGTYVATNGTTHGFLASQAHED